MKAVRWYVWVYGIGRVSGKCEVFSLEWKRVGVMNGDNGNNGREELTM